VQAIGPMMASALGATSAADGFPDGALLVDFAPLMAAHTR
jgi:hypothetical protein